MRHCKIAVCDMLAAKESIYSLVCCHGRTTPGGVVVVGVVAARALRCCCFCLCRRVCGLAQRSTSEQGTGARVDRWYYCCHAHPCQVMTLFPAPGCHSSPHQQHAPTPTCMRCDTLAGAHRPLAPRPMLTPTPTWKSACIGTSTYTSYCATYTHERETHTHDTCMVTCTRACTRAAA